MKETDLTKIIRDIDMEIEELKKDREAARRLLDRKSPKPKVSASDAAKLKKDDVKSDGKKPKRLPILKMITSSLNNIPESFSSIQLRSHLARSYKIPAKKLGIQSINNALSKLHKRGAIKVTEKGSGQRPTIYKKTAKG